MGDLLPAYRIIEDGGLVVAKVEARDKDAARREIETYAKIYARDGKIAVQERVGNRWKVLYILAPQVSA